MRSFHPSCAAVASIGILCGCDMGPGTPRPEAGPLPLTSPDQKVTRLRQARGSFNVRTDHTLWEDGKKIVEPKDRIRELCEAMPKELIERLATTQTVQLYPDRPAFERPTYQAHATVVSLTPDVVIVTVREMALDAEESPFAEWNTDLMFSQSRRAKLVEGLNADASIVYFAGTLLPWSSEMYVVSCSPDVATGALTFEDDHAEIAFRHGKLVLTRSDGDVTVVRRPTN